MDAILCNHFRLSSFFHPLGLPILSMCRTLPRFFWDAPRDGVFWAVCTICLLIHSNSDEEQAADFVASLQQTEPGCEPAWPPVPSAPGGIFVGELDPAA